MSGLVWGAFTQPLCACTTASRKCWASLASTGQTRISLRRRGRFSSLLHNASHTSKKHIPYTSWPQLLLWKRGLCTNSASTTTTMWNESWWNPISLSFTPTWWKCDVIQYVKVSLAAFTHFRFPTCSVIGWSSRRSPCPTSWRRWRIRTVKLASGSLSHKVMNIWTRSWLLSLSLSPKRAAPHEKRCQQQHRFWCHPPSTSSRTPPLGALRTPEHEFGGPAPPQLTALSSAQLRQPRRMGENRHGDSDTRDIITHQLAAVTSRSTPSWPPSVPRHCPRRTSLEIR